jgi:hypothetical protein
VTGRRCADTDVVHGRCELADGHAGNHRCGPWSWRALSKPAPPPDLDRITDEEMTAIREVLRSEPPGVPSPRPARKTDRAWPPDRRELARQVATLPPIPGVFDESDVVLAGYAPRLLAEALAEVERLEGALAETKAERDDLMVRSRPGPADDDQPVKRRRRR